MALYIYGLSKISQTIVARHWETVPHCQPTLEDLAHLARSEGEVVCTPAGQARQ